MEQSGWAERLAARVGRQVAHYREELGMSAQAVAKRCGELGHPLDRSVIAKLELGRRQGVSAAELFVLATALRVPPLLLVMPVGQVESVEVLPGVELEPLQGLEWAAGLFDPRWPVEGTPDVDRMQLQVIELYRAHASAVRGWEETRMMGRRRRGVPEPAELQSAGLVAAFRSAIAAQGLSLPPVPGELAIALETPSYLKAAHDAASVLTQSIRPPAVEDADSEESDDGRA